MSDRPMHVMVAYEASVDGRAALLRARALASGPRDSLTVVADEPTERLEAGCLRCRSATALWNQAMREVAGEDLARARALLGDPECARYRRERGRFWQAIGQASAVTRPDVIVLPGCNGVRAWGPLRRVRLRRLRNAGEWEVLAVPGVRRTWLQWRPLRGWAGMAT